MALVAYLASPRKADSKKRPLPATRVAIRTAKRVADMMRFASIDSLTAPWHPHHEEP